MEGKYSFMSPEWSDISGDIAKAEFNRNFSNKSVLKF